MKLNEIDLYLTEKCNLNCDFCSVKANLREPAFLDLKKIFEIISVAKKFGLEELHLTGGEPTLRSDLEEVISYGVNNGLNVRLITNGTLIPDERLKNLYKAGLRSIMISIDGMKEYHNKVRGVGVFEKVMSLMDRALELNQFVVRANSVAWQDNMDEIIELTRMLNQKGVGIYSVFLGSPLGYGENSKENVIQPYKWREFIDQLEKIVKEENIKTKVVVEKGFIFQNEWEQQLNDIEGRGIGCYSISSNYDYFLIRGNGDVYPCVFYSNDAPPIGNILNENFEEILLRFSSLDFYQSVGYAPNGCKQCNNSKKCKGGCRGFAKIYSGNWNDRDPRCSSESCNNYFPVCPIMKKNLNNGKIGGSSEQALKT